MIKMYYLWEFITLDGNKYYARFTDAEIAEYKKMYPEIKWSEND